MRGLEGRVATALLIAGLCAGISPAATAGEIEKRTGWLNILWGDGPPESGLAAHQRVMLASENGDVTELEIGGVLARGAHRWHGQQVEAVVERFTDGSLPRVRSLRSLTPNNNVERRGGVSGSQPWVSILCKFSDIAAEPEDLAFFQGMYGNSSGQLDHYWRELSYDAITTKTSSAGSRPRSGSWPARIRSTPS